MATMYRLNFRNALVEFALGLMLPLDIDRRMSNKNLTLVHQPNVPLESRQFPPALHQHVFDRRLFLKNKQTIRPALSFLLRTVALESCILTRGLASLYHNA